MTTYKPLLAFSLVMIVWALFLVWKDWRDHEE